MEKTLPSVGYSEPINHTSEPISSGIHSNGQVLGKLSRTTASYVTWECCVGKKRAYRILHICITVSYGVSVFNVDLSQNFHSILFVLISFAVHLLLFERNFLFLLTWVSTRSPWNISRRSGTLDQRLWRNQKRSRIRLKPRKKCPRKKINSLRVSDPSVFLTKALFVSSCNF